LSFQFQRYCLANVTCGRFNRGGHGRPHVLGYLKQSRDEARQKMPHLGGIGFERSQLTLPVVEPSAYGSPHILILSISDASEYQQLASRRIVYLERGQNLFDVDDAR
jgi:hypothetical protein